MNNRIKPTLLLASLLGLPVTVNALDGTLSFTGSIVAQGCSVTSAAQTITMGSIAASVLDGSAGITTSGVKFTIAGNGCPANLSGITFTGPVTANNGSGLFALSADSTADNVALGIYEQDNTTSVINGEIIPITIAGGGSVLNQAFFAKYVSTAATVTPGIANATVDYTLNYQ